MNYLYMTLVNNATLLVQSYLTTSTSLLLLYLNQSTNQFEKLTIYTHGIVEKFWTIVKVEVLLYKSQAKTTRYSHTKSTHPPVISAQGALTPTLSDYKEGP